MIYMILIICYPEIHFIANQGTYTMDTSIKVTNKCPSKWADDRPIVMGVIFVVDKFRFCNGCISSEAYVNSSTISECIVIDEY